MLVLVRQDLLDALTRGIAGGRHDGDRGTHAALRADAVCPLGPARLIEQLARLRGVVAFLHEAFRRRPTFRDRRTGGLGLAEEELVDDLLLGRGVDERTAHPDVAQHRVHRVGIGPLLVLGGVDLDALDPCGRDDDDLEVGISFEVWRLRLQEIPHALDFSRLELGHGDLA